MKYTIIALLLVGSFSFGCQKNESRIAELTPPAAEKMEFAPVGASEATSAPDVKQEDGTAAATESVPLAARKPILIRTANLRMEVKDLDKSTEAIEQLVKGTGSFIGKSNYSTTNEARENQLVIRVKADRFEQVMKEVTKQAIFVNNKNVYTDDVTMEYIDTEARLRNKKEVEQRYLSILRNQARTVKDVLAAEEQLRVIREEIEAKEGQLRYLQNQVSMSTINLVIYQKTEYEKPPEPTQRHFGNKLVDALTGGLQFLGEIVLFLIAIWPILIAGVITWWWWKRKRKNKTND